MRLYSNVYQEMGGLKGTYINRSIVNLIPGLYEAERRYWEVYHWIGSEWDWKEKYSYFYYVSFKF